MGGGVCIYVSEVLSPEVIEPLTLSSPDLQSLFTKFVFNGKPYVIGNLYRPPSRSLPVFLEKVSYILEYCRLNYADHVVYMLGDTNVDLLKYKDNTMMQNFAHSMFSYDFTPVIRRPTRVTITNASLIDHIWSNDPNIRCGGIIRTHVTDHFPVFVVSAVCNSKSAPEHITYRDFSASNKLKFKNKLSLVSWYQLISDNDVDSVFGYFSEIITSHFIECFPLCSRKIRTVDTQKPYIDDYIKGLIREKRKLLKL